MATRYVLDLETAPRPGIMDTFYPMWASKKYPNKDERELEDMAALYPEFGMICVASFANAFTDDPPVTYKADSPDAERLLLNGLFTLLDSPETVLIGHNIKGFDIPFLCKRYLAHRMPMPKAINPNWQRPYEMRHRDTMEVLKFGGYQNMSLESACLLLGIDDPKDTCCGSDVPRMFRNGELDKIAEYCIKDVKATRQIVKLLSECMG